MIYDDCNLIAHSTRLNESRSVSAAASWYIMRNFLGQDLVVILYSGSSLHI